MNEPTDGYAALTDAILAAIDAEEQHAAGQPERWTGFDPDRKRVASDLAGLRLHRDDGDLACTQCSVPDRGYDEPYPCPDAVRYAEGLRRTAALYGVTASAEAHAHG